MRASTRLKRAALHVTALAAALLGIASAHAQQPATVQPLKIVVPGPAGVPIDVLAREISRSLPAAIGRPVVVDNKPGAGLNIGTEFVAGSPADGNTLLLTANNAMTINPLVYSKLRFNPMADLVPVAGLVQGGYVLVTGPKSAYQTLADVVAAGKQKPDAVSYGSYGYGSMSHICMEQLQAMTGTKLRHVPYKAPFITDIASGQLDIGFETVAPTIPLVLSKRVNAIALSQNRITPLPGVPATSEIIPGFECTAFVGVYAPKGTPQAVIQQLSDEITKIVKSPAYASFTDNLGMAPFALTAQQLGNVLRTDSDKWKRLIPPLNIKLD